jgi:hypothetical protein
MPNKEPGEHKGNDRYVGYSMDLMKEIANVETNFQFEFRLVPNNKHAELVNDLIARVSLQGPTKQTLFVCHRDKMLMCSICCSRGQTSQSVI